MIGHDVRVRYSPYPDGVVEKLSVMRHRKFLKARCASPVLRQAQEPGLVILLHLVPQKLMSDNIRMLPVNPSIIYKIEKHGSISLRKIRHRIMTI